MKGRTAVSAALLGSVLSALIIGEGCRTPRGPLNITVWTWSQGPRRQALAELAERFDRHQPDAVVSVSEWPIDPADREEAASADFRRILEGVADAGEAPALIEVPDQALPALIQAGLARDVGGRFAERLGVRFDDFLPGLLPGDHVASQGVAGLPLYREAPLIAWRRGAVDAADWRERGWEALGAGERDEGERPLAAAADWRVFLAFLRAEGVELTGTEGEAGPELDRAAAERAWRRCLEVLGGRAFPSGPAGERAARAALERGEARAAWIWSSALTELPAERYEVVRAPARTRGTWLVVHSGAGWRERQAAFRLARWITEPYGAATLAARFWTVPVRRSAAASARYRSAPGPRGRREVVAAPERGILLIPASSDFVDVANGELEEAMRLEGSGEALIHRLQRSLGPADEG